VAATLILRQEISIAKNVHCDSLSSNAPEVHPVNYALLQKFFTQADVAPINV